MNIAEKIKAIRKSKGITPTIMAKALDIEPTNYPRLENRGDRLSYEYLVRIVGALGISMSEFLSWGEENESKSVAELDSTKDMQLEIDRLKARIEELDDRLQDKQQIIRSYETAIDRLRSETDYILYQFGVELGLGKENADLFDFMTVVKSSDVIRLNRREFTKDELFTIYEGIVMKEPKLYELIIKVYELALSKTKIDFDNITARVMEGFHPGHRP
ncbi:helix-turn-helix domain-containing protein [Arsenicibacter rosenii]|uniref:HTH cro/C1-type domain-containing protein n=1 Tax=Arsenicibacter rosenii TaxID=1750698 RepID=A0A1S2VIQ3_9BACT|nr:helix-turn-helix transcriptional regulator [Arsenicibacter rosenii]OIN58641.1 hypothetical protein BLX24_13825 [Arsenicibacter rosenii]